MVKESSDAGYDAMGEWRRQSSDSQGQLLQLCLDSLARQAAAVLRGVVFCKGWQVTRHVGLALTACDERLAVLTGGSLAILAILTILTILAKAACVPQVAYPSLAELAHRWLKARWGGTTYEGK